MTMRVGGNGQVMSNEAKGEGHGSLENEKVVSYGQEKECGLDSMSC